MPLGDASHTTADTPHAANMLAMVYGTSPESEQRRMVNQVPALATWWCAGGRSIFAGLCQTVADRALSKLTDEEQRALFHHFTKENTV